MSPQKSGIRGLPVDANKNRLLAVGSALSRNQLVGLDVETSTRCLHGDRVIHRRRARLEDERPQLREVLTPVAKVRKTVPAEDSLVDTIPSPDKARRRLARNLAQSWPASLQAPAAEISSAR